MFKKKFLLPQVLFLSILWLLNGCATTTILKGVNTEGNKAYIGKTPIDDTQAYQQFLQSPKSELDRIHYLLNRIKTAEQVTYGRNGTFYSNTDAYEAGIWMIGNSYNESQDAITFLSDYVWHAKPSLRPHLAKLADGSVHAAYYLFVNELALLNETIQNK